MLLQLVQGLSPLLPTILTAEGDVTLAAGKALGSAVTTGTVALGETYHRHFVNRQCAKQHRGKFATYDIGVLDGASRPTHLFGIKYARNSKSLLADFDLFVFDLLAAALENLHQVERGHTPTSFGAIACVTSAVYEKTKPQKGAANLPSPYADFFPPTQLPRNDLFTFEPSLALDNPGSGKPISWVSFRVPTAMTRSHLSKALTGGLNPKLLGYFLRPAFRLELAFEHVTLAHGTPVASYLIAARPTRVAVQQQAQVLTSLSDVLPYVP